MLLLLWRLAASLQFSVGLVQTGVPGILLPLSGVDEIVTVVTDSPVDVSSCFLNDGGFPTFYPSVNTNARKVISYRTQTGAPPPFFNHSEAVITAVLGDNGVVWGVARSAKAMIYQTAGTPLPEALVAWAESRNSHVFFDTTPADIATTDAYPAEAAQLDALALSHQEALIIVPAGDMGLGGGGLTTRALAKNVLAVGTQSNDVGSFSWAATGVFIWRKTPWFTPVEYGIAYFGPPLQSSGPLVASLAYVTPNDGCTAITSDVKGKIALIDRGACFFFDKALNAQRAGAVGVIIVNNVDYPPFINMLAPAGVNASLVTIPCASITRIEGLVWKQDLGIYRRGDDTSSIWVAMGSNLPVLNGNPMYSSENVIATSSRGPTADGRTKPELVAPGYKINTALECGTALAAGSTLAAAHVAGAAALVREALKHQGLGTPSAALVKAVLIHGARTLYGSLVEPYAGDLQGGEQGFGAVHLAASMPWIRNSAVGVLLNDSIVLSSVDSVHVARVSVGGALWGVVPLKATLVWMDVPAAPGDAYALVNDLDLEVVSVTNGWTWVGNGGNTWEFGIGVAHDDIHNVEHVVLHRPPPGDVIIRVRAKILESPQTAALIVTGPFTAASAAVADACACALHGSCYNDSVSCECDTGHLGPGCTVPLGLVSVGTTITNYSYIPLLPWTTDVRLVVQVASPSVRILAFGDALPSRRFHLPGVFDGSQDDIISAQWQISNASHLVLRIQGQVLVHTFETDPACPQGWMGVLCEVPICYPSCENEGECTLPNQCSCHEPWKGFVCNETEPRKKISVAFVGPYEGGSWFAGFAVIMVMLLLFAVALLWRRRRPPVVDEDVVLNEE